MKSTMVRRLSAVTLMTTLGVTLLAACGRADSEAPAGSAAADGGPAIADVATGEIEIWAAAGNGEALQALADEFTVDNPDVTFVITEIPWGEIITVNQTAAASGSGPDIAMMGADQTSTIVSMGRLAPVPDGVFEPADFYDAAVASVTGEDALYGVPWYVETRFLFYRADIAADLGFEAPTTWDELQALSTAYANRDGGEFGFGLPRPVDNPAQIIVPFVSQAGGSVYDESGWTFDTPEFIAAMDYYQGFFDRGESPLAETEATFENGGNPMYISGPWMVGIYEDLIASGDAPEGFTADSIGFVPLPSGAANNDSYIGGGNLGVYETSDNKASAWKFLQWILEDEQQRMLFDVSGSFPSLVAAADYEPISESPVMEVLKEQMPNTVETPSFPAWSQIASQIGIYAERVAYGEITSEEAAAALQADADALGFGW